MKIKRVFRYYCEFCKKSGCNKHAIQEHEKHCTMNPNRICRMCEIAEVEQLPIDELKVLIPKPCVNEDDYGSGHVFAEGSLNALLKVTECPACILSAIGQSGYIAYELGYDYKKEVKEFWNTINNEQEERENFYPY